jgi:MFS family permease
MDGASACRVRAADGRRVEPRASALVASARALRAESAVDAWPWHVDEVNLSPARFLSRFSGSFGDDATDTEAPLPAVAPRARTFQSLQHRNFRLFFFGQLISNSGNWLTMVALVLLILHRTNSGLAVGAITACQFGPILLLSAWAGLIADRSNKRRLLFVTQTLEMIQSFALATLAFLPHAPTIAFYLTAVAGGCMLAFDNPVRRSFVTEMVGTEDVPNAVTLYSALVNACRIIGPALAGVLIISIGFGWCFTADAITYVFVLIALGMMRPQELRRVPVTPKGRGQVRAGIRYITTVPELWISFVMLAVIGTVSYNFSVIFPLFIEKGLGGGDAGYTAVYATFGLGALVAAILVARGNYADFRRVVVGAALFGVAIAIFAAVPSVWLAVPAVVLVGVTSIMYMTATTAMIQVRADPQMHGRVLALQTVLLIGTTPIGGPALGAVADVLGPRSIVIIAAVAPLVAATFGAMRGRSVLASTSAG